MNCDSDCENYPIEKYIPCMKDFEEFERQQIIEQSKEIAMCYEGVIKYENRRP